jgi:LMBR1 domain-containing protein 1
VDQFLRLLARVYPLDFVALALIVIFFYFSTLTGISRIGIRVLCLKLYGFKRKGTYPQGILIGAAIMMLVVLALNMQIVILAPGYAYWGSQTWVNVRLQ